MLRVTGIDDSVTGIRTLRLAAADGCPLPSFPPGAHIVVECGAGPVNAYSLTGDGADPDEYTISVLECPAGSGGSRWIHHELTVGATVVAHPPRSAFAPALSAKRHLLIAAGIGITPMISHLRAARRWGRTAELFYVHREGRGAYLDEIKTLTDGRSEATHIFTDRAEFSAGLGTALATQPFGTHLYVCGPSAFMDDVVAAAAALGWPPSRIHLERFGIDALDPGRPFEVELQCSGDIFTVDSGMSLLEALLERGHRVPNLCRHGVCGECRIPVSGGGIAHRDFFLSEQERQQGDSMMCCVSRAAADRLELPL